MFGKVRFRGEVGYGKNDHGFRFLGNIELYERPLTSYSVSQRMINEFSHASLLYEPAMKGYILSHHVHTDSHLAYFFLNYGFNGNLSISSNLEGQGVTKNYLKIYNTTHAQLDTMEFLY